MLGVFRHRGQGTHGIAYTPYLVTVCRNGIRKVQEARSKPLSVKSQESSFEGLLQVVKKFSSGSIRYLVVRLFAAQ